jgi:hypothetical protein
VALEKAKADLEALQYAANRAGETIDRMSGENRCEWLRQAERDFQRVRAECEQLLTRLIETRELLAAVVRRLLATLRR